MNYDQLLAAVEKAALDLGRARAREMSLEDERPLIKRDAIVRIMARDGIAATPAEKIVETDDAYMAHRQTQREAVIDAQVYWGRYESTRLRAQLAVNLAHVPEVV